MCEPGLRIGHGVGTGPARPTYSVTFGLPFSISGSTINLTVKRFNPGLSFLDAGEAARDKTAFWPVPFLLYKQDSFAAERAMICKAWLGRAYDAVVGQRPFFLCNFSFTGLQRCCFFFDALAHRRQIYLAFKTNSERSWMLSPTSFRLKQQSVSCIFIPFLSGLPKTGRNL